MYTFVPSCFHVTEALTRATPLSRTLLHNVYCVSEKRGSTVFIHGTYLLDFFGVPSGLGNCDPADNENKHGLHTAFSSRVGWLHDHTVGKLTSDAGTHCQQSGRLQVIIQPVQRHQVFVLDVQLPLFWHESLKKEKKGTGSVVMALMYYYFLSCVSELKFSLKTNKHINKNDELLLINFFLKMEREKERI